MQTPINVTTSATVDQRYVRTKGTLVTFQVAATENEAGTAISKWRHAKGYRTAIRRRTIKADGVEVLTFVAVVWRKWEDRPEGSAPAPYPVTRA